MNLDRMCPQVPDELVEARGDISLMVYFSCVQEAWEQVLAEVMDQEYIRRSHHNVGTYDQGCRGPLCRKAQREHPRRKSPAGVTTQLREERIYDPVIEYFHVVVKHRIRTAQQELLKELA